MKKISKAQELLENNLETREELTYHDGDNGTISFVESGRKVEISYNIELTRYTHVAETLHMFNLASIVTADGMIVSKWSHNDDDDIESFRNAWHIGVGIAKDADFSRREKRREEYAEFCESL